MAQLLIALRRDPVTGKQNIIVKLDREEDALPIEHEQLHRKLVEKLLGQGLAAAEIGELIIERDGVEKAIATRDDETRNRESNAR